MEDGIAMTGESDEYQSSEGKHRSSHSDKKSKKQHSSSSSSGSRKRRHEEEEAESESRHTATRSSDKKKETPATDTKSAWDAVKAQTEASKAHAAATGAKHPTPPQPRDPSEYSQEIVTPAGLDSADRQAKVIQAMANGPRTPQDWVRDVDDDEDEKSMVAPLSRREREGKAAQAAAAAEAERQRILALYAGKGQGQMKGISNAPKKPPKMGYTASGQLEEEEDDDQFSVPTHPIGLKAPAWGDMEMVKTPFVDVQLDPKPFWYDEDEDAPEINIPVPAKQKGKEEDEVQMSDTTYLVDTVMAPSLAWAKGNKGLDDRIQEMHKNTKTARGNGHPTSDNKKETQKSTMVVTEIQTMEGEEEQQQIQPQPQIQYRAGRGKVIPARVPLWKPGHYTAAAIKQDGPMIQPILSEPLLGAISSVGNRYGETQDNTVTTDATTTGGNTTFLINGNYMTALVRADSADTAMNKFERVLMSAMGESVLPNDVGMSFALNLDRPSARVFCTNHNCKESTGDDGFLDPSKVKKGGQFHLFYTDDADTVCATAVAGNKADAKLLIDLELNKLGFSADLQIKQLDTTTYLSSPAITILCTHFDE